MVHGSITNPDLSWPFEYFRGKAELEQALSETGLSQEPGVVNAVGPETFTFRELVVELARVLGFRRLVVPAPAWLARWGTAVVGRLLGDVVLTRERARPPAPARTGLELPNPFANRGICPNRARRKRSRSVRHLRTSRDIDEPQNLTGL